MTLHGFLLVGAALFCIGLFGLLTRRHAIGALLSVEVMANAANLNVVAFGHWVGGTFGHALVLFALALTVAEVAVGLALVLLLHRANKDVLLDLASRFRG